MALKNFSQFPLFQSHIDWAHYLWRQVVRQGECVIDATCGNGHDTLILAQLSLEKDQGAVYAMDIQESAIENTKLLLKATLQRDIYQRVRFFQTCHSRFPNEIEDRKIALIVYNLGYLPGSSKELTTQTETSLMSIQNAMMLLKDGGCISITCYPGHAEGEKEEEQVLLLCASLDPQKWSCCHHRWVNRKKSPSLLWIQKESMPKH